MRAFLSSAVLVALGAALFVHGLKVLSAALERGAAQLVTTITP